MATKKAGLSYGKYDFVGKIGYGVAFSVISFIFAIVVIMTKGFNYGIDFAGGVEMQVKFTQDVGTDKLNDFLKEQGLEKAQVQGFGSDTHEYLIRFESAAGKTDKEINELNKLHIEKITSKVKEVFGAQSPEIRRVDAVGPQVGSQLKRNSTLAAFYALLAILIYVGFRFDYKYAPGAVLCLFHDSVIVLGILALMGREINVQILAAILTLLGYSINDTIVVYDRIREVEHAHKGEDIRTIINHSINETLSRTIWTVATVLVSTLCLYFFAGGVISEFAFAMAVGLVLGTYSSIYVAAPLIVWYDEWKAKIPLGKVAKA